MQTFMQCNYLNFVVSGLAAHVIAWVEEVVVVLVVVVVVVVAVAVAAVVVVV